jgi:uncharacterized protein with von Willebrand factor type A (vWA) domain
VCRKLRQFHPFHQFRAGVVVASSQIAHASETLMRVRLWRRDDVGAALMAVQLSQERAREVVSELYGACFRASATAQHSGCVRGAASGPEPATEAAMPAFPSQSMKPLQEP